MNRDYNKTTSIKVNKEKFELVKQQGYNLQDILDDAMNAILKVDFPDGADLIENKNLLTTELKELTVSKEAGIIQYENKRKNLESEFNKQWELLEKELEEFVADKESAINTCTIKLNQIEKELSAGSLKNKQKKEYENIMTLARSEMDLTDQLKGLINDYAKTYGVNPEELEEDALEQMF